MITPRAYLSWSSMDLLEHSVEKWKSLYFHGEQRRANSGMMFGRKLADGLENNEEVTGDIVLDLLIGRMPMFEIRDKVIEDPRQKEIEIEEYDNKTGELRMVKYRLPVLKNGKKEIPILIKPDTTKADLKAFKEVKTGQEPWTKSRFDKLGQITFYAAGLYLITGQIPKDIEGVWVQTEKQPNGPVDVKIGATGEIRVFKTERTMSDILRMMVRMKKAWELIEKICEEELL